MSKLSTRGLSGEGLPSDLVSGGYVLPQESRSYVKVPTNIWSWQKYLPPTTYSFLLFVISRIDRHKGHAYFGIETAMFECNISENVVRGATKLLERLGILLVCRRFRTNRYYLCMPRKPSRSILEKYLPKLVLKYDLWEERRRESLEFRNKYKKLSYDDVVDNDNLDNDNLDNDNLVERKGIADDSVGSKGNAKNVSTNKGVNVSFEGNGGRSVPCHEVNHSMKQKEINKFVSKDNKSVSFGQEELSTKKKKMSETVDFLVKEGITAYKARLLSRKIPDNVDIKGYIEFIYNRVARTLSLRNRSGFLIYTIENGFCEDYLVYVKDLAIKEGVRERKEVLFSRLSALRDRVNKHVEYLWNKLSDEERISLKADILSKDSYLRGLKLKESTMESFYINHLRGMRIPSEILSLLDMDELSEGILLDLELFVEGLEGSYGN